jgi:hypothetical protein
VYRVLFALTFLLSGCAYRFGLSDRALPGGYTAVAIPMFKNKSQEVGIEPLFTNALIRRFERSQVAHVSDKESSPVVLEGTIVRVETVQGPSVQRGPGMENLPGEAVLITEYRLIVRTSVTLKRKSDDKIIWQGDFSNERVYSPPRIGPAIVNSANATYNQSARIQTISLLAEEMMVEAHDRITENY